MKNMKPRNRNTQPRTRTLAELLLEPDSRGLPTPTTFIKNVLTGFLRERELSDLACEIGFKEFRAVEFRGTEICQRYLDEAFILNRAYDMLAEMLDAKKRLTVANAHGAANKETALLYRL